MKRLTEMERVDSVSEPTERRGRLFYTKRLAAENQASIYFRDGLEGIRDQAGRREHVERRRQCLGRHRGRLFRRQSCWSMASVTGARTKNSIHLLDVDTRQPLSDKLPLARYMGASLNGKALYYSRIVATGSSAVFSHALGTAADKDVEVLAGSYNGEQLSPLDLVGCHVSENGHWLIVTIAHGVPSTREDILLENLRKPGATLEPLVFGIDSRFQLHH